MTNIYTIELTDVEKKSLEYVAISADSWIQNAVHERCRLAMEELVAADIADKMAKGLPISGTKEEMVMASTLPSAKDRHEETLAKMNSLPIPG